jgi:hypothetical protein
VQRADRDAEVERALRQELELLRLQKDDSAAVISSATAA